MTRHAALALLCAALAGCSAVVTASPAPASPPALSRAPGKLVIGTAADSYGSFLAATGVAPAIVQDYTGWGTRFSVPGAGPAEAAVQIQPRHAPLGEITAGRYDKWLESYASSVRSYGKPVILSFGHEMNGDWSAWGYRHASPAAFIAAWRHVVTVFRQAGAANVTWMWTVNGLAPGISDPREWFPGAQWVGMVGVDQYYNKAPDTWASQFQPTIDDVRSFWAGPVLLSETGIPQYDDQAAKLPGLFAGAAADHLWGILYFDHDGTKPWILQGAALAAFKAAARRYG